MAVPGGTVAHTFDDSRATMTDDAALMATILVLHGPNLALQGLSTINSRLEERASELGVELTLVASNGEPALLDALHENHQEVEAIIVNPGVLAPMAFALAEGLSLIKKPTIEVLLAAPTRGPSALTGVVSLQIHDRAADGYVHALETLAKQVAPEGVSTDDDEDEGGPVRAIPAGKSIGRRPAPSAGAPGRPEKTIGRREAQPTTSNDSSKTLGRRDPSAQSTPEPTGRLTRQVVKGRIKLRLEHKMTADELASWARTQWTDLQRGAQTEDGAKELLDGVLLTLMGGAKTTDHILLAQMAKLDS
jgi:3-dehydroquinate dehydratase II